MKGAFQIGYEDSELSQGSRTFAQNLEILLDVQHVSKAELCRHAGISRSQLARFLQGSSYPKPAILVKICDLLSVDARILTHSVVPEQKRPISNNVHAHIWDLLTSGGILPDAQNMDKYLSADHSDIEDGYYYGWLPIAGVADEYYCLISRFRTLNGIKVFDVRDIKNNWPKFPKTSNRSRRQLGICFKQAKGFCILHFISDSKMKYFSNFERVDTYHSDFYGGVGFWSLQVKSAPFLIQPMIFEKIDMEKTGLLSAARESGFRKGADLPPCIRHYFGELGKSIQDKIAIL